MGIKLIKKTNEAAYTAIKDPEQPRSSLTAARPKRQKH